MFKKQFTLDLNITDDQESYRWFLVRKSSYKAQLTVELRWKLHFQCKTNVENVNFFRLLVAQ